VNQKEALAYSQGKHNADIEASIARLKKGRGYEDNSTIIITPTIGTVPSAVLPSWFQLITPMNTAIVRIFVQKQEVGEAYNETIESIIKDPNLAKCKYILTLEADNIPPPNGLLLLLESIKDFDAVGGLYWTKGEGGQPMIYGSPTESPIHFRPQVPIPDAIQPCCGLGMGFTLFRMSMFKDPSIQRPLFRTAPGSTQDLYFFKNAAKRGYRMASDNRCRVGHLDVNSGVIW
jgi:hypothetical protein